LVLSYRYGGFRDEINEAVTHKERNHLVDLAYWINNEYALAASMNHIRSNLAPEGLERATAAVYGLSVRRNFLPRTRHQAYLELGGGVGDYCTCGDGLPRRRDNLGYLKFAIGFDFRIRPWFAVGLHVQSNFIVDRVVDKYAYNVFTLSTGFIL